MLTLLVVTVIASLLTSAFCSMMEAALYAVPKPYVRSRADAGSKTGKILLKLKEDISKPIAAILIMNTLANTAGAALAGWAAGEVLGADGLFIFSICFTLAILYCSEITPKLIGVMYCKQISSLIAYPLKYMVLLLKPLILVSDLLSKLVKGNSESQSLTLEEIRSITATGTEEGALDHFEGSVITNVIGLDETLVKDVLTPRVVVHRLNKNTKLSEIENDLRTWQFSRVPLFDEEEPEHLIGYVTQRDVASALLEGKKDMVLLELIRPIKVVPELMRVDKLLLEMFAKREHICSVVDEHGALAGIITLEDIIEEIVGREIVDEYDSVSDLRTFAKLLGYTRSRRKKTID